MASNMTGGSKIVAATYAQLSTSTAGVRNMHIRNFDGNSRVMLGDADGNDVGFLNGGEGLTLQHIRPCDVYVKGTAADVIFWLGDRA